MRALFRTAHLLAGPPSVGLWHQRLVVPTACWGRGGPRKGWESPGALGPAVCSTYADLPTVAPLSTPVSSLLRRGAASDA